MLGVDHPPLEPNITPFWLPANSCGRYRSYLPWLESVSSIRNLRTHHDVVTWDPSEMIT